jgi:DNA-binding NarL/FixJ family response regulator
MLAHVTIIIAHHHHFFRIILQNILQSYTGLCVLANVDNKADLLEKTKELSPDVIIADIALPGIEENAGLEKLVADCENAKVIVSWRYREEHKVKQAMKTSCAGYIAHDAVPPEYFVAIKQAMKGKVFYCSETERFTSHENSPTGKAGANKQLTKKQLLILYCISLGFTNREIAVSTDLTEHTVSTYRKKFKNMLRPKSSAALENLLRKYDRKKRGRK